MSYRCCRCGRIYAEQTGFCGYCLEPGTLVRVGVRPVAAVDALPEVVEAADLASRAVRRVRITAYPQLELGDGALVGLYGPPSGLKTTTVLRMLDSLDGPAVLVSSEQGPGPALAEHLARLGVRRRGLAIVGRATVDQVVTLCAQRRAVALALDSITHATWSTRDLRHLLAGVVPSLRLVLFTIQVTKEGLPRGSREIAHECDVLLRVEGGRITAEKSRFQAVGASWPVFLEEVSDVRSGTDRDDVSALSDGAEPARALRSRRASVHHLSLVRDANVPEVADGAARGGTPPDGHRCDDGARIEGSDVSRDDESPGRGSHRAPPGAGEPVAADAVPPGGGAS